MTARPHDAFAACQPGLEPLVQDELKALGVVGTPRRGGVEFRGDTSAIMRAAYRLGCASHVLLRVAEFRCRALGELERKARDVPWGDWLLSDVALAVRATSSRSRVYHTKAIAERVGDAIRATIGDVLPAAADDSTEPVAQLAVRFRNDVCTVSLDATTTPLHRRGYRLAGAKAPLREDLAHALARLALAVGPCAVLDPFCGSGTIPIEAAGLLRGLAPGRLREPPLAHLALFDADSWEAARATASPTADSDLQIAASDRDRGAVDAARQNAERAGVADAIDFTVGAFAAHDWLAGDGAPTDAAIATNPPFGRRIGKRDLVNLYQTIGHRLLRHPGWRIALLAEDIRLARRTGLPLDVAFTTKHGGLSVSALAGTVPTGSVPTEKGPTDTVPAP